jgi:spore maturation protein CgeB
MHQLNAPKDCYILTHDRNYAEFVRKFYPNIKGCYILPPAGEKCNPVNDTQKIYDLSFIGSYHDPQILLAKVKQLDEKYDGKASVLAQSMIDNPDETYEAQASRVMGRLSADEHYELSATYFCAMTYYREKIIRTILDAGLTLHVFGDSWKEPAFSGYPNLIIHPLADAEDSLKLYAQSKVSLNIMSWHKDGMTERIANSMLNRAVVLSDPSTYLTEHYTDDREIVYYHLTRLDELPGKIRKLLADDDYRETIAENACKYAAVHDTWDNRAEEFLKIIDEINPQ